MMLNKEALLAAKAAIKIEERRFQPTEDEMLEDARTIIEAYLAALPDDGLVKEARNEARTLDGDGFEYSADIVERLADALEAARAKQRGDVVDLGDLSRSQMRRLSAMASTPKGWRLVPEVATREWAIQLAHLRGIAPDKHEPGETADEMSRIIGQTLAAAPEVSDDR